jgi:hypothetical protein
VSRRIVALIALLASAAFAAGALAEPLRSPEPPASSLAGASVSRGAVPTPPAGIRLEVGEAVLTSQLNAWIAGRPLGETPLGAASAQDLAVQLRDNQVIITGTAQTGQVRLPVELASSATVQAGHVLVQVRGVKVGGAPVPEPTRQELQQRLQDQVDKTLGSYPISVQSVQIEQATLVIVALLS